MRTMYDSVRPSAIPDGAEMVAGYVDGLYAWRSADWARFPDAVHVTISAIGVALAHVVDVETGCVWPPERAVPWVQWARSEGYDPTVYCNWQNDLQNVKAAFIRAGVPEPHYWVAKYDGVREIPAGTIGKQHSAPEAPGSARAGGHYDVSSVADYWPGVDKAPQPGDNSGGQIEPPKRKRREDMANIIVVKCTNNPDAQVHEGFAIVVDLTNARHRFNGNPAGLDAMCAATDTPMIGVSASEMHEWIAQYPHPTNE